jgi:hypothetical protein
VALAFFSVRVRRADVRVASAVLLGLGASVVHLKAWAVIALAARPDPDRLWIDWTDASWALLVVAASGVAWTMRRGLRPLQRALGVLLAFCSMAAAVVGDGLPMPTALVAWGVLAAVLGGLAFAAHTFARRGLHRWLLPQLAMGVGMLLGAVWLGERGVTDWGAIDAVAMSHRAMASAVLLVAVLVGTGWLVGVARRAPMLPWNQGEVNRVLRVAAWSAAGVLVFVASSSEIARVVRRLAVGVEAAPNAALSVWWSLFAVATIVLGVRARGRRGVPAIRWVGLGLLAVTGVKVLLIDMAALEGLTRIGGSAVVGLVMLAAGVGYAWMMGRASPGSPRGGAQ